MKLLFVPIALLASLSVFSTSNNIHTFCNAFATTHSPHPRPRPAFAPSWTSLRPQQSPPSPPSYSYQHAAGVDSRLFMGWGPDPIWSSATITSVQDACPSGKTIAMTISVPPETATEYTIPGQYVQVRLNDDTKPAFLAIASPPNAENASFDFLIKKADSVSWLTALKAGATLETSQVLGSGYKVEENFDGFKYDFPTQNVILVAAGSGIAPLASVIESDVLKLKDNSRSCRLYYGEQTADDLCCVDSFSKWEEMGIEVVPVLSQADSNDNWQGRVGYVQTALEEDGIAIPRNSGALVCGMKGMAEAVSALLKAAGVFEGRILFNF